MELLFNYGSKSGDSELYELIGHIDKDISFEKLKSDLEDATIEVVKLIGKEVYAEALAFYKAESEDIGDVTLIKRVRYPIALEGYRNYAKSSDITHGNNGRKIRVDEHIKVPFEWMIDRDDEAFERKYYKALDNLIDYLDEENETWKTSDAYAKSQRYYVRTIDDFEDTFPISSRLLLLKLIPGLRIAEKQIPPIITTIKNTALKAKIIEGTELDPEEIELVELIKNACIYSALAWSMGVLRVTLFPEGILQRYVSDRMTTQGKLPSAKMETELARQEFKKLSDQVLTEIQNFVAPEPTTEDLENLDPTDPFFGFDDCDGFVAL
ncbi:DUF6712 family protein [Formosa undariae]|uniref:DUF6712 family protein n=1 Tax=Formosa undariae TaxID=1325436 RepID=A0ABV5F6M3_9FLAO